MTYVYRIQLRRRLLTRLEDQLKDNMIIQLSTQIDERLYDQMNKLHIQLIGQLYEDLLQ